MAANIGEIRAGVTARIQDDAVKLTTTPDLTCDVDRAILAALEQYQKVRPRERVALVTGAGATVFDYALDGGSPTLAGFSDGLSLLTQIVYPWSSTTPTPTILPREDYAVVRLSTGLVLRFFTARPVATEQFMVSYTAPHILDAAASTVRPSDDEAMKDLGAAHACEMLAAVYSQSTDGSMGADTVNHMSKAGEYRAMAKTFRGAYAAKMNAGGAVGGEGHVAAPAAFSIGQIQDSFAGQASRHFFHGRQS